MAAPLISCIMPTRGRPAYVLQSVAYFQRQDYPTRELIIVDDDTQDLAARLPNDSRVRYVRVPQASIGVKRNRACELANGTIIAQWDDDDWYAPQRLSVQAAPILAGRADVTGLVTRTFFELATWQFWTCTARLHRRLFVHDVHGGTLVYHRRVWKELARYPDRSLAEDAKFLRVAVRNGARLERMSQESDVFVYVRHGTNSWAFQCGRSFDVRGWERVGEPAWAPQDRAFYLEHQPR